jgi:hypothetical protein
VHLTVTLGWCEAEQILRVQLVGHCGERGAEILAEPDLGVAAAGFVGDSREAWIRHVGQHHRLQRSGAYAAHRPLLTAASHTDAVNHHVLSPRPVDHFGLADRMAHCERARVFAVAQHQNDGACVPALAKRAQRLVDSAPQRRRRILCDDGRQGSLQLAATVCERRADRYVVPERSHSRDVAVTQPLEQLVGARAQQWQIPLHASRYIEHDDETYGLGSIVELCNRLRLSILAQFEVVAFEIRHELTVAVGHCDEDPDHLCRAAKHRLLRILRVRDRKGRDDQASCERYDG